MKGHWRARNWTCFEQRFNYFWTMFFTAIRKFTSILFLLAFLVPSVGESMHTFLHAEDSHCNEKTEHHIHDLQHHCELCDFSSSVCTNSINQKELQLFSFIQYGYSSFLVVNYFSFSNTISLLRGPPVCWLIFSYFFTIIFTSTNNCYAK